MENQIARVEDLEKGSNEESQNTSEDLMERQTGLSRLELAFYSLPFYEALRDYAVLKERGVPESESPQTILQEAIKESGQ